MSVLSFLTDCGGACLYWQVPADLNWKQAVEAGEVKVDDDLLVHPEAVKIADGAYTMGEKQ